ncbi:MAG: hypothetical protein J1E29_04920 [Duncaniella sp.]|nr:hypothetical protein [Duncaniella sp.]
MIRILLLLTTFISPLMKSSAKDYVVTLSCDPDGAAVYFNGMQIAETTPAVFEVPAKMVGKPLMFKFVKEGYESKTVTVSYNKKELKSSPIVYCSLKVDRTIGSDPTVPRGQGNARVSRNNPGATAMERAIVRWYFDSDPRGARIFYRVISNAPDEVKNTNETYLTTTPLEETKSFNIQGLTYDNARNVTIEIKVSKRGYEDQVKRFNVRQALDQQEISGFFELVPKDTNGSE